MKQTKQTVTRLSREKSEEELETFMRAYCDTYDHFCDVRNNRDLSKQFYTLIWGALTEEQKSKVLSYYPYSLELDEHLHNLAKFDQVHSIDYLLDLSQKDYQAANRLINALSSIASMYYELADNTAQRKRKNKQSRSESAKLIAQDKAECGKFWAIEYFKIHEGALKLEIDKIITDFSIWVISKRKGKYAGKLPGSKTAKRWLISAKEELTKNKKINFQ